MRRSKSIVLMERLIHRIENGDYHSSNIPTEEGLASEAGVSRMTARKALQKLIDQGILCRKPNGRLELASDNNGAAAEVKSHYAVLTQQCISPDIMGWELDLQKFADQYNFSLRSVHYSHWDDPIIANTLENYECTFLIPSDFEPESFITTLKNSGSRFIVFGSDWSKYGVPSVRRGDPEQIQLIMDHFHSLGHTRIDCLNVQPGQYTTPGKIAQWSTWLEQHGLTGKLYNEPVEPYRSPLSAAYNLVDRLISDGEFDSPALLLTTAPTTLGTLRALTDHGIRTGKDVAIASMDSDSWFEYNSPSITSLEATDPSPQIEKCLQWLSQGNDQWEGPFLLQPEGNRVIIRESTVPEINQRQTPARRITGYQA